MCKYFVPLDVCLRAIEQLRMCTCMSLWASKLMSFCPLSLSLSHSLFSPPLPPLSFLSISLSSFLVYILGGNGYINDYPTGRLLRDAKLYEIGAGTSEIRRLVIGRAFNALFKE